MERDAAVIREMYPVFAHGDIAAVLRALAPQLQWIEAEGFPSAATYTTPEEVRHHVFMRLAADWRGFRAVPREFACDANAIVAIGE